MYIYKLFTLEVMVLSFVRIFAACFHAKHIEIKSILNM